MAKTKELKKCVHGAEEGRIITSALERAVSRERLFLFTSDLERQKRLASGAAGNPRIGDAVA